LFDRSVSCVSYRNNPVRVPVVHRGADQMWLLANSSPTLVESPPFSPIIRGPHHRRNPASPWLPGLRKAFSFPRPQYPQNGYVTKAFILNQQLPVVTQFLITAPRASCAHAIYYTALAKMRALDKTGSNYRMSPLSRYKALFSLIVSRYSHTWMLTAGSIYSLCVYIHREDIIR